MDAQRRITLSEKLKNLGIKPNTKLLRLLSLINMAYVLDTFQFSSLETQLFCLGMRNMKNSTHPDYLPSFHPVHLLQSY